MKRIVLLLISIALVIAYPLMAQNNKVQRCTEEQLPFDIRKKYIRQATEFLKSYYSQLLLTVGNTVIHPDFIECNMISGKILYKPEFPLQLSKNSNHLLPEQYLLELDKLFASKNVEELEFTIDNVFIDQRDFFLPNLASCFIEATYDITLSDNKGILFKRKCRAQCLFPNAISYIQIKLMMVEPVKDLIAYNPTSKVQNTVPTVIPINKEEEVEWTKAQLEKMYTDAKALMGNYRNEKAYEIIRMVAEMGHANAQFDMGWKCCHWPGVFETQSDAIVWWTKAAEQGHTEAQYNLGRSYELGRGTQKDMAKAAHWWMKAAKNGHEGSQYYLAMCYLTGNGVIKDEKKGILWLTTSAEKDYSLAQVELAERYQYGNGVTQNKKLARHWYLQAAEQGSSKAKEALKNLKIQ